MPFVFKDVDKLLHQPLEGSGDCVELIKMHIPALAHKSAHLHWRAGDLVIDAKSLPRGTAIAKFVDGRYPGLAKGNHAAFYLATAGAGFYAMDQWKGRQFIDKRRIALARRFRDGRLSTGLSDAAQAFYVIEL